jgi:hypothetical protein
MYNVLGFFCPFSVGHSIVWTSYIWYFWFPFWYLQTFLFLFILFQLQLQRVSTLLWVCLSGVLYHFKMLKRQWVLHI